VAFFKQDGFEEETQMRIFLTPHVYNATTNTVSRMPIRQEVKKYHKLRYRLNGETKGRLQGTGRSSVVAQTIVAGSESRNNAE
jgi:hypothetical protein